MLRPLEQVFVESSLLGVVRRALERHAGAVVVAGPSASGKTATLYASLHDRRTTRPDSKILMVEDPIEYRLSGVTQVQVQPSAGIGFATVLRAMLRQDPDVIMVGDVRDAETAQIALEAAMTGHLLLTSIHANGALSVVQRLETMGCSRVQIAQSLSLVLVQRLARRLCPHCARLEAPAPVLLESLVARGLVAPSSNAPLPRPVGCDACQRTGFLGRVAVFETLQTTDELLGLLMAGRPLAEVQRAAIESRALVPFQRYAARLLAQKVLAPSEALMIVAD
jgi:type II secretory ATPase GspE/PulE/Tfp pilus assembly ATPase PilB-like protein